jgi:exportin-2 (importin alpha re-exporter)
MLLAFVVHDIAIMRVLSVAGDEVMPMTEALLQQLNNILGRVYKNPTNPGFNHYLFESISILIRNVIAINPAAIQVFESHLFPAFQAILQEDVTGPCPCELVALFTHSFK